MIQKRNYWLLKSEPTNYSICDLKKDRKTAWTGVRNYQARNYMRDSMEIGDSILFYHSNTDSPAIVGVGKVVQRRFPDPTQFDTKSDYYDSKATPKEPRWFCVSIGFVEEFKKPVSLKILKTLNQFSDMLLTQKGSRLSVQPVSAEHYRAVVKLSRGGERE